MKKCADCGFEGKWLTHYCPGPPGYGSSDAGDGYVLVPELPLYPVQIIDTDEIMERKFSIKIPANQVIAAPQGGEESPNYKEQPTG